MDEYILILELVSLKVHYVIWGQKVSSEEKDIDHWFYLCLNKMIKIKSKSPSLHNWINKLTLKDNTISYSFTLFICGGPCHLSSFKQLCAVIGTLWLSNLLYVT